jgi:hypothetical protein
VFKRNNCRESGQKKILIRIGLSVNEFLFEETKKDTFIGLKGKIHINIWIGGPKSLLQKENYLLHKK